MLKALTGIFSLLVVLFLSSTSYAQDKQIISGTIIDKVEQSNTLEKNIAPTTQIFKIELNNAQSEPISALADPKLDTLKIGDKVLLIKSQDSKNGEVYYITDHARTDGILILFIVFVGTVLLISKKAGLAALLGMSYSFFIIFKFLLPQLYDGGNPIVYTLISVVLIAPISFVLSHGLNQKTYTALFATLISLTLTSILALIFINSTHLSGFGSEEAYFLQLSQGTVNIKGIFLAGIIIGTLGILDDATVTQASIVAQLKSSTRNLSEYELFSKAMHVGHDHIASTVNTLILVYTGASLPLLLLFVKSQESFFNVLNNQMVAEEIVTMLVSSIGLILSIPIATALVVLFVSKDDGSIHSHSH